jgi:hypothetical protein
MADIAAQRLDLPVAKSSENAPAKRHDYQAAADKKPVDRKSVDAAEHERHGRDSIASDQGRARGPCMTADEVAAHQWLNLSAALGWPGSAAELLAGLNRLACRIEENSCPNQSGGADRSETDPYP